MKKLITILILLFSVGVYAASPFIFGPNGPISLQPLSGILRATPGNVVKGGVTFTPPLTYDNTTGVISLLPGTANSFVGYNSSGDIFSIPGWYFLDGSGALSAYIARDVTLDGSYTAYNFESAYEATADNLIGLNGINVDTHFDRNNTGVDLQTIYGINSSVRNEGSGFVNYVLGASIGAQGGNGNGGGVETIQAASFNSTLASGTTMTNSLNGIFVGVNSTSGTADSGYLFNGNVSSTNFTNNFNGVISSANDSTFNNSYAMFNGYTNNSNTFNGNNWYGVVLGNDAPISGFADGVRAQFNGNITKNLNGFAISTNANTLTSPGFGMSGFDLNVNNTTFRGDYLNAFNGFVSGVGATMTNVTGLNFYNDLSGTNRFTGVSIYNNEDQIEEIRLIGLNSTGDARTQTGLDMVMTGNVTDDGQGVRVNVNSLTSSSVTNHIRSASFEGGIFQVQSNYKPFSGYGVDIGNNFSVTSTIDSGSPLTGTDQFVTFIQSNLLVDDDISTGPFGLDTTMFGVVSQTAVASGKTVPLLRGMLLGTSVPFGSGGTITEYVGLDILGLPSFGGSVTNPTRTAVQDASLLGQNLCDGATDCWFIRNQDANAENHLSRLAIGTSSKKVSTNVKLEVNDGHIRHTQTTSPVATVDGNAGTGATCSVSQATDVAGKISITTGTIGVVTGAYCSIAFDESYNVSPICVVSPSGSTLSTSVYVTATTTDMVINFAVAGGISSTYDLNYHCLETQ